MKINAIDDRESEIEKERKKVSDVSVALIDWNDDFMQEQMYTQLTTGLFI